MLETTSEIDKINRTPRNLIRVLMRYGSTPFLLGDDPPTTTLTIKAFKLTYYLHCYTPGLVFHFQPKNP